MKAKSLILPLLAFAAVSCGTANRQAVQQEDDVVNIGYEKSLRKDVNGAVGSVKMKRQPMYYNNIYDYMSGTVAGLDIEGDTSGGGVPTIRIRGVNSINGPGDPLVIVDGSYSSVSSLAAINPQDVSSIDVLKDASMTAAYGARGTNGVIIITLKRGGE